MLMVAEPTATPVATPVAASTLATVGCVDVHAMGGVAPVAVSAAERPTATMGAAGLMGNTAVGVITLMTVLCTAPRLSVTLTVVDPDATPLTNPLPLTVATAALLEVQRYGGVPPLTVSCRDWRVAI